MSRLRDMMPRLRYPYLGRLNAPEPLITNPHPNFPGLGREHLTGAALFADRWDLITSVVNRSGVLAEVGVGYGDFSQFLLDELRPSKFVAIDVFRMHEDSARSFWGRTADSMFGSLTHADFYRNRFRPYGDCVVVDEGISWEVLARYPDDFFDLIYLDAAHDFDSVRRDAEVSVKKVKREGGIIVFNDYIMFDHVAGVPYGVVQNVNELVVNQGWHVIGFALQWNLFCDIAIKRSPRRSVSHT